MSSISNTPSISDHDKTLFSSAQYFKARGHHRRVWAIAAPTRAVGEEIFAAMRHRVEILEEPVAEGSKVDVLGNDSA